MCVCVSVCGGGEGEECVCECVCVIREERQGVRWRCVGMKQEQLRQNKLKIR